MTEQLVREDHVIIREAEAFADRAFVGRRASYLGRSGFGQTGAHTLLGESAPLDRLLAVSDFILGGPARPSRTRARSGAESWSARTARRTPTSSR